MNRLIQKLSGRKIAIVGNGNLNKNMSREIDSADIVMRFNHFYNYDSGNVGKRVDIVMQTITPMYFNARVKHDDVVRNQKPDVFLVKNHFPYDMRLHELYSPDVRIDNSVRFFESYPKYTTGTTVLAYLAENLENAEVRCYGFQDEKDWERYLATDAKNFNVLPEERGVMLSSIKKLESLKIKSKPKETPSCIVIPVKRTSVGCPGKNRALMDHCLEVVSTVKLPITVVGDDTDMLHDIAKKYEIDVCPVSQIGTYSDVTDTLRKWKVASGFCGNVALVQCTSPLIKKEWITDALSGLRYAPLTATAVELDFKVSAIYRQEKGVFIPNSNAIPPTSVARQALPRAIKVTGAVEAFHTDSIDFDSLWSSGVLRPIIIGQDEDLDVDTEDDLKKALKMIN